MEAINNATENEVKKAFTAPTTKEEFGAEKTITHTYENGKKVIFLLLNSGQIATIREGKGSDVEHATLESGGDRTKYLSALTVTCTKIDGKVVNMFEFAEMSMKDYLAIQTAFAELNF